MLKLSRVIILILSLLFFLLAGCSPAVPEEDALTKITVCYSSVSAHQAVAQYAIENGIFERYGLDVELVFIEGGSTAVTSLLAGDVDLCIAAGSAIVNAAVAGEDLKIIAGLVNTHIYSLIVQPGIESAEDLKGKSVAVSDYGGSSDTAMRLVLESMGLDPDEDVTILSVGGTSSRLAAMEAGDIAATVVTPPSTIKAIEAGFVEFLKMSDLNSPYQHTTVTARQTFIDNEHDTALSFVKAINDAVWSMKNDREGVYATIGSFMELDPVEDAEALRESFDVTVTSYMPFPTYPTIEGVQVLLDALLSENPAAASFSPADIINTSLLDALAEEGFFALLESR